MWSLGLLMELCILDYDVVLETRYKGLETRCGSWIKGIWDAMWHHGVKDPGIKLWDQGVIS